eukprot:scaffold1246_cov134-Cylindrotheca_fusiformis.AAC.19
MDDWISSLAKKSTSAESTVVLPKDERKRKRAVKKAKRREQLLVDMKRPPERFQKVQVPREKIQANLTKRRISQLTTLFEAIRNDSKNDFQPFQAPPFKKKRNAKGWNEHSIQPRSGDYSGIGLARKSLFISFKDPSFFPTLEEEFKEHIPGFFGKQRTKAMKKQLDGNMLWRQLADKKKMSNKFKNMSPDQRVQSMLDSGII